MRALLNFSKTNFAVSRFCSLSSKMFKRKAMINNPVAITLASLAAVLAIIVFAVSASDWPATSSIFHRSSPDSAADNASTSPSTAPSALLSRSQLQGLLSLQPEANRLRGRIGKRFLSGGREVSIMAGALTVGDTQSPVNIIRTLNNDGESVAFSIGGNPRLQTWNYKEGAKDGGRIAEGEQRSLIERIALDSVDQFILAQARGASYETIAQQARPSEAGGDDGYTGPVWDLVRVVEPSRPDSKESLNRWRVYYINAVTGLIEKVVSKEGDQRIVSELSEWVDQEGEKFPTRYVWKINNQTVSTLSLTSVTFGARQ